MIANIPIDYGVPVDGRQFGLYFYPKDRFLFVGANERIVNIIRSLMRSKLFLSKLDIHNFKNWDPSLIDNTVCSHWGVNFENSVPVLADRINSDESLTELEFFVNMIYWIETTLDSLGSSKSFVLGETRNNEFNSSLSLIDGNVIDILIADDHRRATEFDVNIKQIQKKLHKLCYWAKSKDELVTVLSEFVDDDNIYIQLFHKEILHWWKLN